MLLTQSFAEIPAHKLVIPVGATMDIPTGSWVTGARGENILLGGVGILTGVVGRPNRFKSLLMHFMSLTAMARIQEGLGNRFTTTKSTYDTEINISERRLQSFADRHRQFKNRNLFADGVWTVTDKTAMSGEEWFEGFRKFVAFKKENAAKLMVETPLLERDGKSQMRTIVPTFAQVDSLSAFATSDVEEISRNHELGESGANMMYARQGLAKKRLMAEMPTSAAGVQHFTFFTAHVTDNLNFASSPYAPTPAKQLEHMKVNDKIKGVTPEFLFLVTNVWLTANSCRLINDGTKGPEYPRNPSDNEKFDMDLNEVHLQMLRSKNGQSGFSLNVVISQSEGVLPSLTEFNYLRSERKYWGFLGNNQNYSLVLLPEVKLSRTTVRHKLDNDPMLRRAMNITSEISQMTIYHRMGEGFYPTMEELYARLEEKGYDWKMLLNTRGYYTLNQYTHPVMYLSSRDLINMYHGTYHPYWLESDNKTIKPEFMEHIRAAVEAGEPVTC